MTGSPFRVAQGSWVFEGTPSKAHANHAEPRGTNTPDWGVHLCSSLRSSRTSRAVRTFACSNLLSVATRARTLVSQIVRAQYMVVAVNEPRHAHPRAQGTRVLCIVGTPPERSRPPGQDRSDRSCFHPRSRPGAGMNPRPEPTRASRQAPPQRRVQPVGPFVVLWPIGLCPAPPVAHEERETTALPSHRPASAGFYLSHTPPLRGLNHPGVAARAPGTIPAPAEVPALAMISARPITSVAGVNRRSRRRTSGASAPA